MAFADKDWEIVRYYYERGLSLAEIVKQDNVKITDRSSISKKAKTEGWQKGLIQQAMEKEVQLKQELAAIDEEKSTFAVEELKIHNKLVNEKLAHVEFFNKAAITNVKQAMADVCEGQQDYKARAETINKGRETVLGKTPDTAIQINNNNQAPRISFEVIDG